MGSILARGSVAAVGSATSLTQYACEPGASSAGTGGAIRNEGTLELTDVMAGPYNQATLGVICSLGALTLTRTSVGGNYGDALISHGTTTIVDGSDSGDSGFAIKASGTLSIRGGVVADHQEYGVRADGAVTIERSTISRNQGPGPEGSGTLTVTDSTISGNSGGSAGGIAFAGCGTLTNTTISGNRGVDAEGLSGSAGGIRILPGGCAGPWRLTNVTIADNTLSALTPNRNLYVGVAINGGPVEVKNTLLANNYTNRPEDSNYRPINCAAPLISLGGNLVFPATSVAPVTDCGFSAAQGDLVNVDPHLGPLASNGGSTQTHAFRPEHGAEALDRG